MLSKIRGNSKGFTLIELMIVIAIIGILAAIAIPNFIAYRNKAFCTGAESDGNAIAAGLSDYYAVPSRTNLATSADANVTLSNGNTGSVGGTVNDITIWVTDTSKRCPAEYTTPAKSWTASVYTQNM